MDGESALEVVERTAPDVAIMDLSLPGMAGFNRYPSGPRPMPRPIRGGQGISPSARGTTDEVIVAVGGGEDFSRSPA